MDASIKGDNIRTFVRLLQCASKYGDDLNIHANSKLWEMSVTNSSKSAFCLFKLDKSFFCRWEAKSRRGVKCRLLVKSVLAVLGKVSQISTVNRLDLRIIDPSDDLRPPQHRKENQRGRRETTAPSHEGGDEERKFGDEDDWEESDDAKVGIEAKLVMRLVCKYGVTKKHSLHLGSSDFLRADVDPNSTPSGFVIATRTLRDWLDHFSIVSGSAGSGGYAANNSGGTNQLGWMFTKNEVRVKSWEAMGGGLSTEIKVDVDEFQDFEIMEDRVDLTLPMKEFKATLVLAEQLSATLNVSFSEPGQPLTLTSLEEEFDDFSIFCAIATTVCEAFTDVKPQTASTEIKRSSSSLRSRTSTQTSNSSKRKSSETLTPTRKRSALNMTSAVPDQPKAMVYFSGPATPRHSTPADVQRRNRGHDGDGDYDMPHDGDASDLVDTSSGKTEKLFLPGGTQVDDDPPPPQVVRMTQSEIADMAGFGDLEMLEEELDAADEEDQEEELRASQRPQPDANMDMDVDNDPFAGPSRRPQGQQVAPTRSAANVDQEQQQEQSRRHDGSGSRSRRTSMSAGQPGRSGSKLSSGEKSNTSHPDHVTHSVSDTSHEHDRSKPADGPSSGSAVAKDVSYGGQERGHESEFELSDEIDWSTHIDPSLALAAGARRGSGTATGTSAAAGEDGSTSCGPAGGAGQQGVQAEGRVNADEDEDEDELDEDDELLPTQLSYSASGRVKAFKPLIID